MVKEKKKEKLEVSINTDNLVHQRVSPYVDQIYTEAPYTDSESSDEEEID